MPSALPDGEPVPISGALPPGALDGLGQRPFGLYLHVPFCATRCGYCDFNTYLGAELGGGALQAGYVDTALTELRLARRVLGAACPPVETVFVGGGTPTLLPAADLARLLSFVRAEFGLAPEAEVTTEANPDSVDERYLAELRAAGFTRVSFGMQSAVPSVLRVLDRTHTAGRPQQAAKEAFSAGFEQVSLDLIYGAPGESDDDWRASLEAALSAGPTHAFSDLGWYEVSNWGEPCRHNLGYWRGADWWGVGPGAHSHVGGMRWWNVRHPQAYADRLAAGHSPGAGRELLSAEDRRVERVLLEVRLREGLPLSVLRPAGAAAAVRHVEGGLLEPEAHAVGRASLTLRGRLLADAVVRDLVD
jgi:oxygen-independent coproporphyrinogen-3 oxidase